MKYSNKLMRHGYEAIPKYVREHLDSGRLKLCNPKVYGMYLKNREVVEDPEDPNFYWTYYSAGYVWIFYRYSNGQYYGTWEAEANRLAEWAKREHASAKVLKDSYRYFTVKEHRKPYYMRDYVLIGITDPVCRHMERYIEHKEAAV